MKDKNLLSSLALGLAASAKWTFFWFIPVLGIYYLFFKRDFKWSYLYFLFLPVLVYLVSYAPFFNTGHTWEQFIELQKQMWWYHTKLVATHTYTSNWWSWPLMLRPVWLYTNQNTVGWTANIYVMGNPAILWFGLVSIISSSYWAIKSFDKKLGFVIFAYLVFFASWAFSPRIMFLYHYLPAIPFLAIGIGYTLRKTPKFVAVFFVIAFVSYVYFYPHYTGILVPKFLDESYYWMSSWR